jgi:hypothetical protein
MNIVKRYTVIMHSNTSYYYGKSWFDSIIWIIFPSIFDKIGMQDPMLEIV